jgi:hypothetical protein
MEYIVARLPRDHALLKDLYIEMPPQDDLVLEDDCRELIRIALNAGAVSFSRVSA